MRNETLFYGGMALAAVSLLTEMVFLSLYQIKTLRLEAQMDEEYGRQDESGILGRKGRRTCQK